MQRGLQGRYEDISTTGEKARAFIPFPLPPDPQLKLSASLRNKLDAALVALGRLDTVSALLPDASLFLYMYVRKEALLSSMIEGTQSSLTDLLLYELDLAPGVPLDDVQEVSNYVAALNHGIKRLEEGFPLSLRLITEIHKVLVSGTRGGRQAPGEFRRNQNWIGGTGPKNAVFVPPPAARVQECMGELEAFLHDRPVPTQILIKAALSHVQFETIHPFLDGNGRVGRLLITLLLCSHGILKKPTLYLSLYFKTHRTYYYELLNDIRRKGDWELWLDFFVDAVLDTASQAVETTQLLSDTITRDSETIKSLGRASLSAFQVHSALSKSPIADSKRVVKETGLTAATVNKSLKNLIRLGIVQEMTEKHRHRLYFYSEYIKIMNKGIEP